MILTQDKLSSFPASMMNIIIKLVHQHHHHQIVNGCPVLIYMQKRPLLKAWGWFLRPIRKSDPAATGFTWWVKHVMMMTRIQSCNDDDDDDNMSVSHLSLRLSCVCLCCGVCLSPLQPVSKVPAHVRFAFVNFLFVPLCSTCLCALCLWEHLFQMDNSCLKLFILIKIKA